MREERLVDLLILSTNHLNEMLGVVLGVVA